MKRKSFIVVIILFCLVLLNISFVSARSNSYGYNYYGEILASPAAYEIYNTKKMKELGLVKDTDYKREQIIDLIINDNYIYLLTDMALIIYDNDFTILKKVSTFSTKENDFDKFNDNKSMTINNDLLYISDDNPEIDIYTNDLKSRILVFKLLNSPNYIDLTKENIKVIRIGRNQKVPGMDLSGFRPQKIKVNGSGKIFLICQDIYQGIIEMDINGTFNRFVGINKIKISALESFWRKLTPKGAARRTYLPVSFKAIDIDDRGFIYAVTDSEDAKPIQKLNYKGENVLIENGNTAVIGDITEENKSQFVDIAINDYGIYLALDNRISQTATGEKSRIFAYNSSGDLLYIIGNKKDNSYAYFERPEKVLWNNNEIVVIDNDPDEPRIQFLKETIYGKNINLATKKYFEGDFIEARENWEKVIELNSNKELSYIGLGKIYYQQEDYHTAIEYFKLGNNKAFYSKSYNYIRNERLKKALVPAIVSLIAFVLIFKGIMLWIKIKKGE